jgi:hypothetical protein
MAVQLSSLILLIGISLSVVLADPLMGLRVGFSPNSSEIALDGVVNPMYNISNGVVLPAIQYNFSFYVSYDYPENGTKFVVDVEFLDRFHTYIIDPVNNTGIIGSNDTQPLYTMLTMRCTFSDNNDTWVMANVSIDGYDPIIFIFMKTCDIPALNLDLVSSPYSIISNHTQVGQMTPMLSDSILTQTYNLWLSNYSEMSVVPYTLTVISTDSNFLKVSVDQSGNNVSQGVNQTITLTFVCNTLVEAKFFCYCHLRHLFRV